MHYVMCSAGSFGDIFPFVKIGEQLKKNGHEVTILCHSFLHKVINSMGMGIIPLTPMPVPKLPKTFDSLETYQALMEEIVLPNMASLYQWIQAHGRAGEMVLISQRRLIGARLANEKSGIPLLTVNLTPHEFENFLTQPPSVVNTLLSKPLNQYRKEIGLHELDDVFNWLSSPDGIMAAFPSWFHTPDPSWPSQTWLSNFPYEAAGSKLPKSMDAFLKKGEKPVLFSFCPILQDMDHCIQIAKRACHNLGKRAVIINRLPDQEFDISEDLFLAGYLTIDQLLPYISGIVYLGGAGTFGEALRAGTPQLIIPIADNQRPQIDFVENHGLGCVIDESRWTEEAVTQALDIITNNLELAQRCQMAAKKFGSKKESLTHIAASIESWANAHSSATQPSPLRV